MKVEEYRGDMTGRVFDVRAITVVSGGVGDAIKPVSKAANLIFTEFDRARVEELRLWWKQYNQNRQDLVRLHFFAAAVVVMDVLVLVVAVLVSVAVIVVVRVVAVLSVKSLIF